MLGVVSATTPGPRGSVEFLVRRDWAEKSLKARAKQWDRATAANVRLAMEQRRKRLEAWRRDRAAHAEATIASCSGSIESWRGHPAGMPPKSVLLSVRLPRSEVRGSGPAARRNGAMLRLAWLCKLPEPETMPLDELRDALEARGYALDADGRSQPVAVDGLLPPAPEPEPVWLARRAASELAVDPDLRFLRFQDTRTAGQRHRRAAGRRGPFDGDVRDQATARSRSRRAGGSAARKAQGHRGPGPGRRGGHPARKSRRT